MLTEEEIPNSEDSNTINEINAWTRYIASRYKRILNKRFNDQVKITTVFNEKQKENLNLETM